MLLVILLAVIFRGNLPVIGADPTNASVEQERLETMRRHVAEIRCQAKDPGFPEKLLDQPLFRYDDLTRGYIDGAVWRLGATGRPKAIVTTELHPKYSGEPRLICDYLSLSETPFVAKVAEGATWTPPGSAVRMSPLPNSLRLAESKSQRLLQLKKMSERFTGHQSVEGQELELRILPRPIDRYQPTESDTSDAAIFLFVSGRNPGIVLVIEATESDWIYGAGRLSQPSTLTLNLDGETIWQVSPAPLVWNAPYTATNYPVVIPGDGP